MVLPTWNMGRVVEGCQRFSCVGLVGQRNCRVVCQTTGNAEGHQEGSYISGIFFFKDMAKGVRQIEECRSQTQRYQLGFVTVWVQGEEKVIRNRKG